MTDDVKVEQIDRELAKFLRIYSGEEGTCEVKMLAGGYDASPVMQAIARHREAALRTNADARAEGWREALEDCFRQVFIEGAEWQKNGRQGRFTDAVLAASEPHLAALTPTPAGNK